VGWGGEGDIGGSAARSKSPFPSCSAGNSYRVDAYAGFARFMIKNEVSTTKWNPPNREFLWSSQAPLLLQKEKEEGSNPVTEASSAGHHCRFLMSQKSCLTKTKKETALIIRRAAAGSLKSPKRKKMYRAAEATGPNLVRGHRKKTGRTSRQRALPLDGSCGSRHGTHQSPFS